MKITDIRLRHLSGTMEVEGDFFEERLFFFPREGFGVDGKLPAPAP